MKRNLKIFGSFFGIISAMMLIYDNITGIINSSEHDTLNIFDSIMLPFSILLFVFSIIILIKSLKNEYPRYLNIICIFTIIISFIIGLLFIWFSIVKSDNNIFYGVTGVIATVSAILLLYK